MNEVKKKLLKILILTTIGISSINCFAMKKNLENVFKNSEDDFSRESYCDEYSSNSMNTPVMNKQDLVGFQNENSQNPHNQDNFSEESNCDEDSSNCMKTPVNKNYSKKINGGDKELNLSYEISDKDNDYLNKKTARKNDDILEDKNSQYSYNQNDVSKESYCDEDSSNSMKTPVNKNYSKKINGGDKELNLSYEISDKDNEYLNKKTARKNDDILEDKNSQNPHNKIDFKLIENLKNELSANSHVINNNFEEKEKDVSSVKANFSEDEDKKYLYEKNSILPEISDKEKFVIKKCKKRIINTILKQHLKNEIDEIIKKHILSSEIENKNNILKNINCTVTLVYAGSKLSNDDFKLKPTYFNILLPDNIKEIFKNKDEEYIDLLLDIISNYRKIFKKSIIETFKELPKLTEENFYKLCEERGTKQSCNNVIQKILKNRESNKTELYNELIYNELVNKNDCLYEHFINFKSLISYIYLKVLDKKISGFKNYKSICSTNISNDFNRINNVYNIDIPQEKRDIKFKDYDNFFQELNKIQFDSQK